MTKTTFDALLGPTFVTVTVMVRVPPAVVPLDDIETMISAFNTVLDASVALLLARFGSTVVVKLKSSVATSLKDAGELANATFSSNVIIALPAAGNEPVPKVTVTLVVADLLEL